MWCWPNYLTSPVHTVTASPYSAMRPIGLTQQPLYGYNLGLGRSGPNSGGDTLRRRRHCRITHGTRRGLDGAKRPPYRNDYSAPLRLGRGHSDLVAVRAGVTRQWADRRRIYSSCPGDSCDNSGLSRMHSRGGRQRDRIDCSQYLQLTPPQVGPDRGIQNWGINIGWSHREYDIRTPQRSTDATIRGHSSATYDGTRPWGA